MNGCNQPEPHVGVCSAGRPSSSSASVSTGRGTLGVCRGAHPSPGGASTSIYSSRHAMTLFAGLLLAGCATSVEYAPPAEEVIVRADGAPYRGAMDRLAVSRDGQFVAFAASGPPLGSGDE